MPLGNGNGGRSPLIYPIPSQNRARSSRPSRWPRMARGRVSRRVAATQPGRRGCRSPPHRPWCWDIHVWNASGRLVGWVSFLKSRIQCLAAPPGAVFGSGAGPKSAFPDLFPVSPRFPEPWKDIFRSTGRADWTEILRAVFRANQSDGKFFFQASGAGMRAGNSFSRAPAKSNGLEILFGVSRGFPKDRKIFF